MSFSLSDDQFECFRSAVYDASGIHLSPEDKPVVESRLRERISATRSSGVDAYHALIMRDHGEIESFLDSISNNLTRFFRNRGHFHALEYQVIPEIIKRKREQDSRTIRIWSAGCSSGEEPYSIAILCNEIVPFETTVEITATDLSLKSLNRARIGRYPDSIAGDVPARWLETYFSRTPGGYIVHDSVRRLISFTFHNLKLEPGFRGQDIVFCRNVLTYLDRTAQQAVVDKLSKAMNEHAYLFIGDSESLFGIDTSLEFVRTPWTGLYRKH